MRGGPFGSVVDEVHLGESFVFPLRLEAVVSLVVVDCMEMFVKNGSLKVLRANGSA